MKVRPREAADQAAARTFLARHHSARVARLGEPACGDQDTRYCDAVSYHDRMTTHSVRPVFLRDGAGIEDPLRAVRGFLKACGRFDVSDPSRPASFASRISGWRTGAVPASQRPRSRRSSSGADRSREPYRRSLPALDC